MERENIANALLWPIDQSLGFALSSLDKIGLLKPASQAIYSGMRAMLGAQFRAMNELEVNGVENIPSHGGVILAVNHQSWLDVQVVGASATRRVHFMAKSEFETWPVLRHLVPISESVYVRRGGDNAALENITKALRDGWAVVIFPEGTIPGEEDIPRRAVDPKTGLLPGHTGVARLALAAGVPIVPVGVSGTGRAFPPEIYPRLEVLRMPGNTPIRIRYGEPIDVVSEFGKETEDRELYRKITDKVMTEISALVDHRCNYVPIQVPLPEPPRRKEIGVLLLHGFTGHTDTVSGLIPHLEAAGIKYRMPWLRGHGTRYQDMRGVKAREWYVDAESALLDLWNHVDRIVVVGLSMGGLVALELGMRYPDKIAGVVTWGAALKFMDPLAPLSGLTSKLIKYWPSPNAFNDMSLAGVSRNYPRFPTDAFAELYQYSLDIAERLVEMHVPIRVLMAKNDSIVDPGAANIIYEKVSSPSREIFWYDKSGHEMGQDCEADQVFADTMEFINRFRLAGLEKTAE